MTPSKGTAAPLRPASTSNQADVATLGINTIRTLAMDAVQKANSGHPGTPMGLAPVAYTLWHHFLRYDPPIPLWPNRDRFVLSAGHASMLLYSLLHLAGVQAVTRRQGDRRAGGQPRRHQAFPPARQRDAGPSRISHTTGVETTTGPLGQGCGNSVGMAIAARWLAARYNRPGFDVFDYDVYALCSDGDMMEGVVQRGRLARRASRASNLCWIYDSNPSRSRARPRSRVQRGCRSALRGLWLERPCMSTTPTTPSAMAQALRRFQRDRRSRRRSSSSTAIIGCGAPHKQDTAAAHGDALGEEEVRLTKKSTAGRRTRNSSCRTACASISRRHRRARHDSLRDAWEDAVRGLLGSASRSRRASSSSCRRRELPDGWDADLPVFPADAKGMATRDSSGKVLNAIAERMSVADRRRRRSLAVDQDQSHIRRRRDVFEPTSTAAATSISACASTPWARSSTAWRCRSARLSASTFLIFSATTCARRSGWRR